jgi:hypothetical protein
MAPSEAEGFSMTHLYKEPRGFARGHRSFLPKVPPVSSFIGPLVLVETLNPAHPEPVEGLYIQWKDPTRLQPLAEVYP